MAPTTTKPADFTSREEAKARLADAKRRFAIICRAGKLQRTTNQEIGYEANQLKQREEFADLGFESENACREAAKVPRSTWFYVIQNAAGFPKVAKKVFLTMFPGKAHILLDLSEDERQKPYWIKRAADPNLDEETLQAEVDMKLEKGEAEKDATSKEDRDWLKIRMYKTDIEIVTGKLDLYCQQHALGDDRGKALVEIVLTYVLDSPDEAQMEHKLLKKLRKTMQENVPKLKALAELLKDANRPADERCKRYEEAAFGFIAELGQAAK